MNPPTPDRVRNRPISADAEEVRELLYEAFTYAGIPARRAAHGARILAEVIDRRYQDKATRS